MIRWFALLCLSVALLLVTSAEAVTGHCAKQTSVDVAPAMSAHCAEMMGMEMPEPADEQMPESSGLCCCAIASAPMLYEAPFLDAPQRAVTIWSRPANTRAVSLPNKVAIPPPRG